MAWNIASEYPNHKVVAYTTPDLTSHKQRVALCRPTYHQTPQPIGVPTYQAAMRNIATRMEQYRGGETHRARVRTAQQQADGVTDALAREGASAPGSGITGLQLSPSMFGTAGGRLGGRSSLDDIL